MAISLRTLLGAGVSGYSGKSGYSGFSGILGTSGYSGISGYSGDSGYSGISGYSGTSGYSGISGYSGFSGISGYSGTSGYSGYSGESGYSGISGYSAASPGPEGVSGYSGFSGISGFSGASGYSGFSGISGYSGYSGISGYSGASGPSTTINATNDIATDSDFYPVFVSATGSNQTATASSTKLYFRPSTGELSATDFNTLSDIAYKENIEPISNALNKVLELRGVSYRMKESKKQSLGVIAQEIEHILPEVVSKNLNGSKTVSYNHIIAVLIEAVKELKEEVDRLKK